MALGNNTPSDQVAAIMKSAFFKKPSDAQQAKMDEIQKAAADLMSMIAADCPSISQNTLQAVQYLQRSINAAIAAISQDS